MKTAIDLAPMIEPYYVPKYSRRKINFIKRPNQAIPEIIPAAATLIRDRPLVMFSVYLHISGLSRREWSELVEAYNTHFGGSNNGES
tara:strand:+ start:361 stop:621 length:261 start_codon:yes stop_codon:yes gene_type:complete